MVKKIVKNHNKTTGTKNLKLDGQCILDVYESKGLTHVPVSVLKKDMHETFNWSIPTLTGCIPNPEKGRLTDLVRDKWTVQKINNRLYYVLNGFCDEKFSIENEYNTETKIQSRDAVINVVKSIFHFNKALRVFTLGGRNLHCVDQISNSFRNAKFTNADNDEIVLSVAKEHANKNTEHVLCDVYSYIETENMSQFDVVNVDQLGYVSSSKEVYFKKLDTDNPAVIAINIQDTNNFRKGNAWAVALNEKYKDCGDKVLTYMNDLFTNYHDAVVYEYRRDSKSAKMKQLIFKSKKVA